MPDAERALHVVPALRGTIVAPPSKSVTQRALIVASLAAGRSRLVNPLLADDSRLLIAALDQVGVAARIVGAGQAAAGGGPGVVVEIDGDDAAPRGGSARLAPSRGTFVIDGSARMRQRPIEDLLAALRALGAAAESVHADGCPPVRVGGRGLAGGAARMPGAKSSQYLSALLMTAPAAGAEVTITIEGELVSRPYVDLTIDVMRRFGVTVEQDPPWPHACRYRVAAGQRYRPVEIEIEGDYSSASYFFAAAAVTGGRVRVEGLDPVSQQGDARLLDLLRRMGCRVERGERSVTVEGVTDLRGIEADLGDLPDAAPTLAVVALFARGATRIRGVPHLRLKESDRIAALVSEIRHLGGEAEPSADGLTVRPRALHGASIATHGDHRMAMAFAVAGLRVPGVMIRNPGCVSKSFPDFWERLDLLIGGTKKNPRGLPRGG
jgi:3-phosphoshikimate 1-carboxyvinyltransferase